MKLQGVSQEILLPIAESNESPGVQSTESAGDVTGGFSGVLQAMMLTTPTTQPSREDVVMDQSADTTMEISSTVQTVPGALTQEASGKAGQSSATEVQGLPVAEVTTQWLPRENRSETELMFGFRVGRNAEMPARAALLAGTDSDAIRAIPNTSNFDQTAARPLAGTDSDAIRTIPDTSNSDQTAALSRRENSSRPSTTGTDWIGRAANAQPTDDRPILRDLSAQESDPFQTTEIGRKTDTLKVTSAPLPPTSDPGANSTTVIGPLRHGFRLTGDIGWEAKVDILTQEPSTCFQERSRVQNSAPPSVERAPQGGDKTLRISEVLTRGIQDVLKESRANVESAQSVRVIETTASTAASDAKAITPLATTPGDMPEVDVHASTDPNPRAVERRGGEKPFVITSESSREPESVVTPSVRGPVHRAIERNKISDVDIRSNRVIHAVETRESRADTNAPSVHAEKTALPAQHLPVREFTTNESPVQSRSESKPPSDDVVVAKQESTAPGARDDRTGSSLAGGGREGAMGEWAGPCVQEFVVHREQSDIATPDLPEESVPGESRPVVQESLRSAKAESREEEPSSASGTRVSWPRRKRPYNQLRGNNRRLHFILNPWRW